MNELEYLEKQVGKLAKASKKYAGQTGTPDKRKQGKTARRLARRQKQLRQSW